MATSPREAGDQALELARRALDGWHGGTASLVEALELLGAAGALAAWALGEEPQ